MSDPTPSPEPISRKLHSRRGFLAGAASAGVTAAILPVELSAQVAGSDAMKIGMIGMGGRGSGAIIQNLTASDSSRLVACAEAFQDKLDGSGPRASGLPKIQAELDKLGKSSQIDVPKSRQYVGFDAYKGVIDECDLVVIERLPVSVRSISNTQLPRASMSLWRSPSASMHTASTR